MTDIENDALAYIADSLTQPQRRAVVRALVMYGERERALITSASEHTVRALQKGKCPLVDQEGMHRFLTPLGRAVARHLNRSGEWELPVFRETVLEVV